MEKYVKKLEEVVVGEAESLTKRIEKEADYYRKSVLQRFPFLIISLSTFGVVAVFYGAEKIIDSIPLLANNPFIMLGLGLFSLAITGTLYKKL